MVNDQVIEMYLNTEMSYSQIAEVIDGTRNQVAGIIHRHCPREAPRRGTPNGARKKPKKLTESEIRVTAGVIANGGTVRSVARELRIAVPRATQLMGEVYQRAVKDGIDPATCQEAKGCRFVTGDVRRPGWHYCQQPQATGSSYCAYHHAVCHRGEGDPKAKGAHTINYRHRRRSTIIRWSSTAPRKRAHGGF